MTEPSPPDHYTQVSAHLQAAGQEVTQLLDLLTDGLAAEKQQQTGAEIRHNAGRASAGNGVRPIRSRRAGEPR
jgi:hypothetical protein